MRINKTRTIFEMGLAVSLKSFLRLFINKENHCDILEIFKWTVPRKLSMKSTNKHAVRFGTKIILKLKNETWFHIFLTKQRNLTFDRVSSQEILTGIAGH